MSTTETMNALLNYGYVILEGDARKLFNTISGNPLLQYTNSWINIIRLRILYLRMYVKLVNWYWTNKITDFKISELNALVNYNITIMEGIIFIDFKYRKMLGINKSTSSSHERKIKEGKPIKLYNKTQVRIEWLTTNWLP